MAILDGVLTSDGIIDLDRSLAAALVDRVHAAGGLWIADEVQGGYGRTGADLWSWIVIQVGFEGAGVGGSRFCVL